MHKARNAGDVEIGNLPNLRKVLNAATRLHKVLNAKNVAKKRVDLWVTEFSWDSKAPDPKAVPSKLHQRWTSESLYRMWKAGVRMVVWFTIRDRPLPQSFWQSGFWYCGHATPADDPNTPLCGLDPANDVRKPSFRAFRFPFVAFAKNGKVSVWGMVPRGAPHKVAIQRSKKRGGGYKTVKSFKAGSDGIFSGGSRPLDGRLRPGEDQRRDVRSLLAQAPEGLRAQAALRVRRRRLLQLSRRAVVPVVQSPLYL